MSARPIQTNFVLLDGKQRLNDTRDALATAGDKSIVIDCGDGMFFAVPARLLLALVQRLDDGRNRSYADSALYASLRRMFGPLAQAGLTQAKAAKSDAEFVVVVERGAVKGVIGGLGVNDLAELCQRVRINLDTLNSGGSRAKPPSKEDDGSLDVQESMESGGGGGAANDDKAEAEPETGDDVDDGDDVDAIREKPGVVDKPIAPPTVPVTPIPTPTPGVVVNTNDEPKVEAIRLDVATPETATVGQAFDMAVAIRQPQSAKLAVDGLNHVASVEGAVYRTERIVKYRVEVEAADCAVEPASYVFKLEKGRDSIVQYFQLTPKREGVLTIVVNAYQADDDVLAASTRVRLAANVQVDAPMTATTTINTSQQTAVLRIYQTVTNLLSLSDLEDVVFRMGLKWDELAGDTLSAKARSLLTLCTARQLLPSLVEQVNAVRPEAKLTL